MLMLWVLLLLAVPALQDHCSRGVHVSVSSRRNRTGHWLTSILWDHEADSKETMPASLAMSQRVRGCSDAETLFMQATLTAPPPSAGPGYALVPGVGRYKFHATAVTWEVAQQTCSAEGGHLAVIRSKRQEGALTALFGRHAKIEKATWDGVVWLGFHDQHSEGDFITVLDESFPDIAYANWQSGKPSNEVCDGFTTGSDCGALLRDGKIIDRPCGAKYAFICEQELW